MHYTSLAFDISAKLWVIFVEFNLLLYQHFQCQLVDRLVDVLTGMQVLINTV